MLSESRGGAARPEGRKIRCFEVVLALLLLGLALWHAAQWRFLCDDAYIALRYAQNWVQSAAPVYNPGEVGVQGFTSPLWVLGMALGMAASFAGEVVALTGCALGAVIGALSGVGIAVMLAPPQRRVLAGLLGLSLIVLCPEFMVWSSGGLETSIAAALGLLAVLALSARRDASFHGLAALAACMRLDSLLWIAAFGLVCRGASVWPALLRRRSVLCWLMPLGVMALQYHYYGSFLPHTFAIKSGGWALMSRFGTRYLWQWSAGAGLGLPLALMAFGARKQERPWLALVGANLGFALWVGGDFMGYSRFLLPSTIVVLGGASSTLVRWSCSRRRPLARLAIGLAGGGVVLLAWALPGRVKKDREEDWLDRRYESVHAMERFAAIRVAAGKAYAARWPKATRVTVGAAGAFPYAAGLIVFDAYGLTDATVLTRGHHRPKARPGHQWVGGAAWVRGHHPHLRCEIGWVGPGFPGQADLKARRPLTQGAQWTCRSTGPVPIRGQAEPLPPQHYCCVRERFEP